MEVVQDVVGVYDSGRGLDLGGFSGRQARLLDLRLREKGRLPVGDEASLSARSQKSI